MKKIILLMLLAYPASLLAQALGGDLNSAARKSKSAATSSGISSARESAAMVFSGEKAAPPARADVSGQRADPTPTPTPPAPPPEPFPPEGPWSRAGVVLGIILVILLLAFIL